MIRGCYWIRGSGGMILRFDEVKFVMECKVII